MGSPAHTRLTHGLLSLTADIDTIIMKGERETKELNEKLKQFTEKAMNFTMDGGIIYEFKEEEDGQVNGVALE